MILDDLKPCPFCGGKAKLEIREPEWAMISCGKCLADGPYYHEPDSTSPQEAARLWNKRT